MVDLILLLLQHHDDKGGRVAPKFCQDVRKDVAVVDRLDARGEETNVKESTRRSASSPASSAMQNRKNDGLLLQNS